jgi:hypothetical protein
MLWPFWADCAIVAGTLFLVYGTAAQAWFQMIEYQDVLETAKDASTDPLSAALREGTRLLRFWRWHGWFVLIPPAGYVFLMARATGLYSAVALISFNMKKIREFGNAKVQRKNAARLKKLLRVAVPWYLLLLGSTCALVGACIQLALGWPWPPAR